MKHAWSAAKNNNKRFCTPQFDMVGVCGLKLESMSFERTTSVTINYSFDSIESLG